MAKYIKDLPLGAKVKFGRSHYGTAQNAEVIKWLIVDKNHRGYPANSVTLFAENAVDCRVYDEGNERIRGDRDDMLNHRGDNDYENSNLDMWFNSDASAGQWFQSNVPGRTIIDAPYSEEENTPGFLYNFTNDEKNSLLNTSIEVYRADIERIYSIERKVFLPTLKEVNLPPFFTEYKNGDSRTSYFLEYGYRWEISTLSKEMLSSANPMNCLKTHVKEMFFTTRFLNSVIYRNTPDPDKGNDFGSALDGIYRRLSGIACADGGRDERYITMCVEYANIPTFVKPATNIKDTTKVTNVTDSEGYYTVIFNTPPTKPSYIRSNTSNILGGNTATISWGTSSDPDGDTVKYILQRKVNGASGWTTIRTGLRTTSYTDSITFGWKTVQYRVAAYDSEIPNDNNSYTLSSVYTITNNIPPTISGSDKDLGTFSNTGTTIAYTVKDAENNAVTVNISIDGKSLSNTSVTLGQEYKINLTGEAWITLNNGRHSVRIKATDSQGASATRTYTFIKSVTKMTFMNKVPYASTNMPGRAKIYVNRQIPTNAIFKVYACNNAFDANPTWEDVTSSVTNNLVYMFTNKTKTATDWGVKIKVVVDRNNTAGECYISEVGGNFA
jgi:hypothetical protein